MPWLQFAHDIVAHSNAKIAPYLPVLAVLIRHAILTSRAAHRVATRDCWRVPLTHRLVA